MIHWISNSRVSLQRLGFCRVALQVCDQASSRGELSVAVRDRVQAPITVDASSKLAQWARTRPKGRDQRGEEGKVTLALQDRWVSEHPSRSGWLPELAHEEYFEKMGLPFLLDMIDDECRATDTGELVSVLDAEVGRTWTSEGTGNPLLLETDARTAFLYAILRTDGDFMIPYMNDLLRLRGRSFSYLDAGRNVPAVMDEALQRLETASYTAEDQEKLRDMELARRKIAENIEMNVEMMGSGSRREQTVLPRLEWLVDLGILERTREGAREYVICRGSTDFVEALHSAYVAAAERGYPEEAVDRVLDRDFFRLSHLLVRGPGQLAQPADLIDFISPGYEELRSPTGYCVGRPLLLLSHLRRWRAGEQVGIEYEVARERLEEAYQRDPGRFYFTTARFGEDFQIRLERPS